MFTGIVETIGTILRKIQLQGCVQFTIAPLMPFTDISIGDSICVNGVCLTVVEFSAKDFTVTVVPETLRLTNLGDLLENHHVNLERALRASDRLGGHYVQGHVEGVGKIVELLPDKEALLAKISISPFLSKYMIYKGYVAIDGMSITLIEVEPSYFTVTFIPHTQAVTIIKHYEMGTRVNIETDIIGKYFEKMLGVYQHAV